MKMTHALLVFSKQIELANRSCLFLTLIILTLIERVFMIDFTDIDPNNEICNQQVALLKNLDIYLLKLKEWYANTDLSQHLPMPYVPRSMLAMPMLPANWTDHLTLRRFLTDESKLVYRADDKFGLSTRKLIKFTRNYSVEVHKKMEEMGFAPKFYRAEKMSNGYFVIEMEYLDGYVELQMKHLDIAGVVEKLESILDSLHQNGFVHGDFRYKNIMIQLDSGGKLMNLKVIDFDLSGKNGVDVYPGGLNPKISWHPTVEWSGKLLFEHDTHFLELMKAKKSMTREHVLAQVSAPLQTTEISAVVVDVSDH